MLIATAILWRKAKNLIVFKCNWMKNLNVNTLDKYFYRK